MDKKQHLIWIDLEMTGLNAERHTILEIASVVTDNNLNIVARGPELIIHQSDDVLARMDSVAAKLHNASGLTKAVRSSTVTMADAEQQTVTFLKSYCEPGVSPLCGNSVWADRMFLRKYMPVVDAFTHYRLIDVSTIKVLAQRWYPQVPAYEKKDAHRALADILESIDELAYYRKKLFIT